MKSRAIYICVGLLVLLIVMSSGWSQERPIYGKIAIVATSATDERPVVALAVANDLSTLLRASKRVEVKGETEVRTEADLLKEPLEKMKARLEVDQIGVVSYRAAGRKFDDKWEAGTIEVTLPFATFEPDTFYFERVTVAADREKGVLGNVRLAALGGRDWIIQNMSGGVEVAVVLMLKTVPGEASFMFGNSGPYGTAKDGYGVWRGTRPAGQEKLEVSKIGYSAYQELIAIQRLPNQATITISRPVRLKTQP